MNVNVQHYEYNHDRIVPSDLEDNEMRVTTFPTPDGNWHAEVLAGRDVEANLEGQSIERTARLLADTYLVQELRNRGECYADYALTLRSEVFRQADGTVRVELAEVFESDETPDRHDIW